MPVYFADTGSASPSRTGPEPAPDLGMSSRNGHAPCGASLGLPRGRPGRNIFEFPRAHHIHQARSCHPRNCDLHGTRSSGLRVHVVPSNSQIFEWVGLSSRATSGTQALLKLVCNWDLAILCRQ
jgi:hypothetical protein